MSIRVLLVDDQPRSRHSLKALLTAMRWSAPGYGEHPAPAGYLPVEVVGEAADGVQAMEQVSALQPDVVVVDLRPTSSVHPVPTAEPRLDGRATIQAIKGRRPAIRIVVLALYDTERAAVLAAGADVFLLKGCPTQELLDAVTFMAPPGLG